MVNAGGMMGASTVIFDTPSRAASMERIHGLFSTIRTILEQADASGQPSSSVADNMALSRINAAK